MPSNNNRSFKKSMGPRSIANFQQSSKNFDGNVSLWIAHKKRQQQIEERLIRITEGADDISKDPKKERKKFYKLMSIVVEESILRFSKSIDLRVINAYI